MRFEERDRLPVDVVAPTGVGRLRPELDDGYLLLSGEFAEDTSFPLGAEIEAFLVFDLDAERVIAQVEVLAEEDVWERVPEPVAVPDTTVPGSLAVRGKASEVSISVKPWRARAYDPRLCPATMPREPPDGRSLQPAFLQSSRPAASSRAGGSSLRAAAVG